MIRVLLHRLRLEIWGWALLSFALMPSLARGESEPADSDIAGALLAMGERAEAERDGGFAIEAYERFLSLFPYDPRQDIVAARLSALRKKPTVLHIDGEVSEATIWIDSERVGSRLPFTHELVAGRYTLRVIARDGRRFEQRLVLPPGSKREVSVRFRGTTEEEWNERFGVGPSLALALDAEPTPAEGPEKNRHRAVVFALAGVTAGGLVATTTLGLAALFEEERFRREPSFAIADRGERLAISADVFLAMSLATGITAVVLHFKGKAKQEAEDAEKRKTAGVSMAPMVHRGGGGVQLLGRMF